MTNAAATSRAEQRRMLLNPGTPPSVAQRILARLGWMELAEISGAARVKPAIRRRAEELLLGRLEKMVLGERVALARRAGPRVITRLAELGEERVLLALLGNHRLLERDAVRLASDATLDGTFLGQLAEHQEWGLRKSVRLALVANPRTPVRAALQIVEQLTPHTLRGLVNDDKVPTIVRVSATRLLEQEHANRPGRPGPPRA